MAPRSAKALAKSKLQRMAVEGEDSDGFLQDANTPSDNGAVQVNSSDEDDYGKIKKKARTKAPVAKQTTHKNRLGKSLSLLPTMPLDVLFEVQIFGQLDPKDIINVARASKIFRETLISKGAITMWKAVRGRLRAPDPPSDMAELSWATLLYGNVCQNCDAKLVRATSIDFMLRRRLCTKCKKSGIFVESRLKKDLRIVDETIFDLVSHTNTGPWSSGSKSRYFWKQDVERMIQKVAALEQDMRIGRQDARMKLDDFKQKEKNIVEEIHSTAYRYQEWAKKEDRICQTEIDEAEDILVERRQEAIHNRFLELGYDKRDVIVLKSEPELSSTTQLTDRIWKRIRLILEPKVQHFQERRLVADRTALRDTRRDTVHDLYQTYKRSLVPSQWRYLPRTLDICKLEPFARLIEAPMNVVVHARDFEQGMKMLPALISSLSERKLKGFRDILLVAKSKLADADQPGEVAASLYDLEDPLELATSVFECEGQCILNHERCGIVGVEELTTHHCDGEYTRFFNRSAMSLSFSSRGAETARSLVQLAGLDPKTASVSDMDRKDLRFTCRRCKPVQVTANQWIANGYSWRQAISYAVQHFSHWRAGSQHKPRVEGCSWEVLPAMIADELKTKEQLDSKWDAELWTCGHCSLYMTDLRDRGDIVRHLSTIHATPEPEEPRDLFMFEPFSRDFEQRIAYSVPKPSSESFGQAV